MRSRQTAEILHSSGLSSKLEESSYLAPDGRIQPWIDWLEQQQIQGSATQLAMVGHQPDLGQWAEILVWGEARASLVVKKRVLLG